MRELIEPTMRGMAEIGAPFSGILFLGLMIGKDGPKLIEYNTRFGDPECQVLMMRLNSDLLALINAAVDGKLDQVSLDWKDQPALTVVMAAEGYPSNVKKGSVVRDLDKLEGIDGVKLFHAGTAEKDGSIVASGGRVLNITAIADTVAEAQARAYEAVKLIDWPEGFYRSDIGWRAVERETQVDKK
jgi:phosphoribosylamine--glycine ligase